MTPTRGTALIAAATAEQAVAAELAGAGVDAVIAYHSSVYRQMGISSVAGLLPWACANEQTLAMLPRVLAGAGTVPTLATVCANDRLSPPEAMVEALAEAGVRGVLNAPTVGLFTGPVRDALEQAGLGAQTELDLIDTAHRAGLLSWCYVVDAHWTRRALDRGADAVVVHLGITGVPGATDPRRAAQECLAAVDAAGADVPVLLHGGPIRTPEDFDAVLGGLEIASEGIGFFGASTFERDPAGRSPGDVLRVWRRHLSTAVTR